MTDSKLSKKHHPRGSLSRRVLTVSIILLVIPLILQTLFQYKKEYDEKLADVKEILTLLGTERANVKPLYITTAGKDFKAPFPIQISYIDAKGRVIWQNGTFDGGSDLVSVAVPIQGAGGHLKLATSAKSIHDLHLSTYLFRIATLLFFVGGIGGFCVYLFTRRVNLPLKNLCQTMERVSDGAIHARYSPDWMGFEINQLGLQFNETLDDLIESMEEVAKERLEREKLAEELKIGHEIQKSLVPAHTFGFSGVEFATKYIAAKEVNGDFYDLFRLPNGKLLIVVCDTAGKGISACLFSLGLRSMIRSIATLSSNLSECVRMVNDLYFLDAHESSMFSTVWFSLFDPEDRSLTYCTQGHPPALLKRQGKIKELWTGGIALGAQKIDVIETKREILNEGDLLVVYTDGITEAHNQQNELFGRKRVEESLNKFKEGAPEQIANQLIRDVSHFSNTPDLHDDITLVICQF